MKADVIFGGFRKRNLPIPADYRPIYKIAIIICILRVASNGNKASLNKLHFFIWSLKSVRNMAYIKNIIDSGDSNNIISWGVEPALNRALAIGVSEGLLSTHDDKYILTDTGIEFYKKLNADTEILVKEKEFLNYMGKKKVTEAFIQELTLKLSN